MNTPEYERSVISQFPAFPRHLANVASRVNARISSVIQKRFGDDWPLLFDKLLLVYQMPKTGSQTVEATLQRCSLPHRILRFHYISRAMADEFRRGPASNCAPELWQDSARPQLAFMARTSRLLSWRKWFGRCGLPIPKVQIIAAVRDPISLALSSVFENHHCFFSDLETATLADLVSVLSRSRLYRFQDWFDLELNALTGMRAHQKPFSPYKGYAIYDNSFARVLVYRFDALPKLRVMLRDFLGCELPHVIIRNRGEAKDYAELYAWAKANVRLPGEFVATQVNSPMIRHFYSTEERAELLRRWSVGNASTFSERDHPRSQQRPSVAGPMGESSACRF